MNPYSNDFADFLQRELESVICDLGSLQDCLLLIDNTSAEQYSKWLKQAVPLFAPTLCKKRYPGSLAMEITKQDLAELSADDLSLFAKKDGVRALVIFNGTNVVFLDRKGLWYKLSPSKEATWQSVCKCPFVIECEIVNSHLYCFDLLCWGSTNFSIEPFETRWNQLRAKLTNDLEALVAKGEVMLADCTLDADVLRSAPTYNDFVEQFPFAVDGLILVNKRLPYQLGRNKSVLKWKPVKTLDVRVSFTHLHEFILSVEEASSSNDGDWVNLSSAEDNTTIVDTYSSSHEIWVQWLQFLQTNPQFNSGDIVEVSYHFDSVAWTPLRLRTDKLAPNNRATYRLTTENIQENLTFEDHLRPFLFKK